MLLGLEGRQGRKPPLTAAIIKEKQQTYKKLYILLKKAHDIYYN